MSAIITETFRIKSAQDFIDSVGNPANNYYIGVGRISPWGSQPEDDIGSDDMNPPFPASAVTPINLAWIDLIGAKKLGSDRVSLSIPRYDWEAGEVYDRYDSQDESLFRRRFYVLTDDYNIYKCIDNNDGAVVSEKPTGTGAAIITTADGYRWKFMYTLALADVERFLTPQHMAVRLPGGYVEPSTGGTIDTVTVDLGGTGYTAATVSIIGDGVGATATANLNAGVVESITVTNAGSGYNYAHIEITGDGIDAVAHPNISPRGGHGWNPVEELGGFYVTMNVRMEYDESGNLSVDNDFRKIVILRNPTNQANAPFTGVFARQTTDIVLENVVGTFTEDEVVEGQNSGALGRVVDFNAGTNTLRLTRVQGGNFAPAEEIIGQSSAQTGDSVSVDEPDLKAYSGKIEYLEYRRPIARSQDQIEELRITIEW